MLKINLLPPYIYEGKKRGTVAVLWLVIVLVVAGACVFGKIYIDGQTAKVKSDTDAERPNMEAAQKAAKDAEAVASESKGILEKATFVRDAQKHASTTYPPLFRNIRDYTISNVLYRSLTPRGQTVSLSAYAPTLASVGQYMMYMEHNPEITGLAIDLAGLTGYPEQAAVSNAAAGVRPPGDKGFDFNVRLSLAKAVASGPRYGNAPAAATGGGMMGGMTGPGGGMPGMMSGPGGPPGMAMGPSGSGGSMGSMGMAAPGGGMGGKAGPGGK